MADISLRRRLPRDCAWAVGLAMAVLAGRDAGRFGLGWDAQAYFHSWDGAMYDAAPGTWDAYLYSPAFAQALWPLTRTPWPVFCAVMVVASAVGIGWLLRPLGWLPAVPLWLACLPEIFSGNIYWIMGVVAVLGLRDGYWWAAPALTKVLPDLGPFWFVFRGEWKAVIQALATTGAIAAVSFVSAPGLWRDWIHLLMNYARVDDSVGTSLVPPLGIRLIMGVGLIFLGARTGRAWLLPVSMLIVSPVIGAGSFAVLAAIPRMRAAGSPGDRGKGRARSQLASRRRYAARSPR